MKKEIRNCRCCLASYEKPTDYWCQTSLRDVEGNIIEPIGFCEFCDKNNSVWYEPKMKCHYMETKTENLRREYVKHMITSKNISEKIDYLQKSGCYINRQEITGDIEIDFLTVVQREALDKYK